MFDLKLDFSSSETALKALKNIDKLMNQVSGSLTEIGSTINRLETVLDSQNTQMQNLISSRSTIMDADIADVSANYVKMQILQQASATLMASSRNLNRNNVMALINGINRG